LSVEEDKNLSVPT